MRCPTVFASLLNLLATLRSAFRTRAEFALENLALRQQLIRRMAETNVTWGAPRIHGELLKLGIEIRERGISRFMPKRQRKPPSQTWRTFLDDHRGSLASIDFFTVPTATLKSSPRTPRPST